MKLKRKIITYGIIIVLLAAGYLFAKNYEPPKESGGIPKEEKTVIFETDPLSLEKITVKNTLGGYTLLKNTDWYVEGKEYIELTKGLDLLLYSVSKIEAGGVIENAAADLSKYGLDIPAAEITVSAGDDVSEIIIGADDPTGNYRYLAKKGDSAVYIISRDASEPFFAGLNSLRSMKVSDINTEDVRGIETESGGAVLKIKYLQPGKGALDDSGTASVWEIQKPVKIKAQNGKVSEKVLKPACAVTAFDIAEDNPADLSKYGFNARFVIETVNGDKAFLVSEDDGVSYVYPEGGISVFRVTSDGLDFLKTKPEDIMQNYVAIYNIDSVLSVSYISDGIIKTLENKNGSFSVDGQYADKESYTALYQKFIGLTADGIAKEQLGLSPEAAKIRYVFTDGSEKDIAFYGYDDLNYAVSADGNTLIIKKTKLRELEKALRDFK